ncbi:MAG: phosphate ABC transporter substrate-binding protein [Bdellovibrionota bacterium]
MKRKYQLGLAAFAAVVSSALTVPPSFAAPSDSTSTPKGRLAQPQNEVDSQKPITVDPSIAAYVKATGVSGSLSSVGSDTLNNVMTLWAEKFKAMYPNVQIGVEGKGSGTAPPALISATAQLGPMSRAMKPSEEDEFEKKFGYKPTKIRVAVDALGVFVNKDNPIKGFSIEDLDGIFSKTHKLSAGKDITTWGQLGLTGEWAAKPISLYGRNSASGTYGYFKEHALENGDFKDQVKEQPGSASVVQGVTVDKFGIGYSGIGYRTSGVRAVALKGPDNADFVDGTAENAYSGDYPLARFLYIYVNKAPGKPLDKLTGEFLKLIESKEGQEVVIKDGYYPLPASVVKEELATLTK